MNFICLAQQFVLGKLFKKIQKATKYFTKILGKLKLSLKAKAII